MPRPHVNRSVDLARFLIPLTMLVTTAAACAAPVERDVEVNASSLEAEPRALRLVYSGDADDLRIAVLAVDAWVSVCGPIATLEEDGPGMPLLMVPRSSWAHPGLLGITSSSPNGAGSVEVIADMFQRDRALRVMAHEIGHALGAAHREDRLDIMNETSYPDAPMPTADDCTGLWYHR